MIAILAALAMQVEFERIIDKQAEALFVTAACWRYMDPAAKGDLDLSQYPEPVRPLFAEAIAMGERQRFTYAKCSRVVNTVRKDQAK